MTSSDSKVEFNGTYATKIQLTMVLLPVHATNALFYLLFTIGNDKTSFICYTVRSQKSRMQHACFK